MDGKCFSDCLYPQFIDSLNQTLTSQKHNYDFDGIRAIAQALREEHP